MDPTTPAEPALPVRLRLPPHRSVFRLGRTGRLLGLDPAAAPAVDELPDALAAMLDELVEPVDSAALVARAVARGADADAAARLLRTLFTTGVLVDAAQTVRQGRRRRESTVLVAGDGPLAVGVVLGLVRAGVGTVHTRATGTVLEADLGTGLLDTDRGRRRALAIRDAVRRLCPGADAEPAPQRLVPDLVVLADALAPQPAEVARLHATRTAHLPVRLRDGIGVVGPLVLPARTACLGCLELQRAEQVAHWPTVAAQLVGRAGRADPAQTVATAALATAQALAALDATLGGGPAPPTTATSIELDLAAGTVLHRPWAPAERCGCGAAAVRSGWVGGQRHDPTASADPGRGETIMV